MINTDIDSEHGERTAQAKACFKAMFCKLGCRSFIRLIDGLILLRGDVIYTYTDTDVYMSNINIASNCKKH